MFSPDLFKGKKVLVTGGRSGIGYEISKQFLELGASVFIASRKEEPLKEAAKRLSEFGTCHYVACDIRKPEEVEIMVNAIVKEWGDLDILVNNAGGQFPMPAELISENGWATVINNNLNGTFNVSRAMANKFFIPKKSGNIVNITAVVSRGFPGMAHTGAARAGVQNLTMTLGVEWAKYNIRVNSVAPGIIQTSGLETYPDMVREHLKTVSQVIPMKRLGTSEEVAYGVLFLASPLASYTTGVNLTIDGASGLYGDSAIF